MERRYLCRICSIVLVAIVVYRGRASLGDDQVSTCEEGDADVAFEAKGQHVMLDIRGADFAVLNNESTMRNIVAKTVRMAGLTQLSLHSHRLEPQGVSVVAILKESHMAVHTWPENGAALADLFSCRKEGVEKDRIAQSFIKDLGGDEEKSTWSLIHRGD